MSAIIIGVKIIGEEVNERELEVRGKFQSPKEYLQFVY